jgi:subtilisin-like proprotein convertase family protein
MCLGDPAVRLTSSSSSLITNTYTSGTINVPIPEGTFPTGPYVAGTSTIAVAGIPVGAAISRINVRMNITHAFVGDVVAVLQAPNGQRINLDALLNATNNPGANFVNTVISSAGTTLLSAGTAPWTNTFRADAVGATFVVFGFTLPGGPVGYIPTTSTWPPLYGTPNGNWTLALYDAGAPDIGTLTNWSMDISYIVGVPSTAATWSPIGGLFNDALASIAYTGDARDTVWTRPTPSGVYNYSVTVQSLPASNPVPVSFTNPANIVINQAGPATPYPSNLTVSGLATTGVSVNSVILTGMSHTWGDDIDVLLQSPTGQNVVLMSDVGGTVAVPNATYTFRDGAAAMNPTAPNPTGTYRPTNNGAADNWPAPGPGAITQATPTLALFTGDMNGIWKLFVFDDIGGDAGNISGGYTINFNIPLAPCTSPARTVVVTVNQPTVLNAAIPVNQTVCTDKVATFSTAVTAGTGPHNYQWQVSTNAGVSWTNVANGGVYSGATTVTLTITAPPVSMSGYQYRAIVTGAAPCAAQTSRVATLTVNPLPVIVISATLPTSLLPGLTSTLSSTVTPNPAATYSWIRNGAVLNSPALGVLSGLGTGTIKVDVDGMGDYQLRVTDVNGCTNISNTITIKDSASGKCFIYPNPTSGKFQVRYYSVANNVLPRSLTIYDAKGDRVLTQFYTIGRPYDRMDVDMRGFGKGLYWVEIGDLNGNRLTMCRVVIQ